MPNLLVPLVIISAYFHVSTSVWFGHFAVCLYVDGSISKGAIYMLGVTSYEESRNRKNLASSNATTDSVANIDRHNKAEVCVRLLLGLQYDRTHFTRKSSFSIKLDYHYDS